MTLLLSYARIAALCAALVPIPALPWGAGAARVEYSVGEVRVLRPDGSARAIQQHGAVFEGETVVTGRDARVGLRFSDGGTFRLQPDSRLRIDDYRFDWVNRRESRSTLSLLRGALRAVSGLIGHYDPDRFRLVTAVSTVGVRGTEYELRYTDHLVASVSEGEIRLCNGGGCSPVRRGETYYVPLRDAQALPVPAASALDEPGTMLLPGDLPLPFPAR